MDARQSQSGMASFLIVMIMMIVITLIVLGFSQVTRRNAREALDRQLSSQAFYAAESGVNVTTNAIAAYVKANSYTALPAKTTCPADYDPTNVAGTGGAIADLGNGVRYTCVLVNPNPGTLQYNPTQQGSTVVPLQANGNLKSLTFTWKTQANGTDYSCSGSNEKTFPQAGSVPGAWDCDYGIVRLDLVGNPSGNLSNLAASTASIFMTPLGSHTGSITLPNFNPIDHAYIASASGCTGGTCSVTLNLNPSLSSYAARVTSIYRNTPNLVISGVLSNGTNATFSGAQAVVDVTGQAQDQLRRIQVRVQLSATADPQTIPSAALGSSTDICKHFSIIAGSNVDPTNLCQ